MRPIDADALEKFLSDAEIEATKRRKYVFASALNTICGNVRNFPTIKPERKTGEWISPNETFVFTCTACGRSRYFPYRSGMKPRHPLMFGYNYCPDCGARMSKECEKND